MEQLFLQACWIDEGSLQKNGVGLATFRNISLCQGLGGITQRDHLKGKLWCFLGQGVLCSLESI